MHHEDIFKRKDNGIWDVGEIYSLTNHTVRVTSPPGVRFQRDDVYDAKPDVPGDVVDQRIDDAEPHEHRQRPHRHRHRPTSSSAVSDDEK